MGVVGSNRSLKAVKHQKVGTAWGDSAHACHGKVVAIGRGPPFDAIMNRERLSKLLPPDRREMRTRKPPSWTESGGQFRHDPVLDVKQAKQKIRRSQSMRTPAIAQLL